MMKDLTIMLCYLLIPDTSIFQVVKKSVSFKKSVLDIYFII